MSFVLAKVLLVFLVPGCVEYELRTMPSSYSVKKEVLDRRAAHTDLLVLGNSHALCGINPRLIGPNATNAASVSQSLHYDAAIASSYLDRMPRLRAVVVQLSYFSFRSLLERWEPERAYFYGYYFGVPAETPAPRIWSPLPFMANYGSRTLRFARRRFRNELRIDDRGWQRQDVATHIRGSLNDAGGLRRVADHRAIMRRESVPRNVAALETLFRRLDERGICVVLVTTPVLRSYWQHADPGVHRELVVLGNGLAERHRGVFRDFLTDGRFGLADFFDHDHLNPRGAETFTRLLIDEVLRPALGNLIAWQGESQ